MLLEGEKDGCWMQLPASLMSWLQCSWLLQLGDSEMLCDTMRIKNWL
jgi:hypothetical protein